MSIRPILSLLKFGKFKTSEHDTYISNCVQLRAMKRRAELEPDSSKRTIMYNHINVLSADVTAYQNKLRS